MTDAHILDILIGAVVLLSLPLGFWRGVGREVFVSAGILLGIALAAAWADRWGRHASDWLSLGDSTGRFVVAVSLVLASVLALGYGGARLGVAETAVGLMARMVGAAVAAANVVVLLSWALAAISRDVADSRTVAVLDDAIVAGRLRRDDDWVLLAVSGGAFATVVVGLLTTALRRGRTLPRADTAGPIGRAPAGFDRLRPVRFARDTDEGKFEPESRRFDPRSERFGADAASLSTSIPLTHVDQARWSRDTRGTNGPPAWGGQSASGVAPRRSRLGNREWVRRPPAPSQPAQHDGPPPSWSNQRSPVERQCDACGAPTTATDAFCPKCGTAVSR